MNNLHEHYDQLNFNQQLAVDAAYKAMAATLKEHELRIDGDDTAERVVDAIARGIIESRFNEFRAVIMKHSSTGYAYHDQVKRLLALSKEHQQECNAGHDDDIETLEQEIIALAHALGVTGGVAFSQDPRGATVRLLFADGFSDSMTGKGFCVPI